MSKIKSVASRLIKRPSNQPVSKPNIEIEERLFLTIEIIIFWLVKFILLLALITFTIKGKFEGGSKKAWSLVNPLLCKLKTAIFQRFKNKSTLFPV
jgi:hypothetical protein